MTSGELRKHFFIFLVFASLITFILVTLPFLEPFVRNYVLDFFGSADPRMGATAADLFETFLKIFRILVWMGLVFAIVRFFNSLVTGTILRNTGSYELTTLLRNVLSIIIFVVAFTIIVKSQFGTDLTTFLAGSTIVAVVIGLALQDTLGNLFAGIAMQADQPFQVGDVINIPNKGTGVVENVTWRGVKIRTFQNKLIIISNANLGKEAIEVAPRDNLNARLVFFNTLYSASPARTIQLIREVVRQVDNVSPKIRPIVRIRNLGESGIDWEIKYWLEDYSKYNDTDALVRLRVWYAFQRENINFAFPTRTLYIENQSLQPDFEESVNAIFERLSDVPLFAPLNDEETQKLAQACEAKIFSPNEPIVRKGEEGGSMFVIHRGSVKVQIVEENGLPKTINTLHEGDFFGEMGLFTGEPRTADVVASEETEVLEIKQAALKPLFDENPELVEDLSKTIAERRALLAQKNAESAAATEAESRSIFDSIKSFFGLS
jgi:small-conductance mechanosensitive channel/CRP-like cAMP-binding protein